MTQRPVLFLDVDGTLIPFGTPSDLRGHEPARPDDAHPLLHRVRPAHGRLLAALPCDLVWATTWMQDANDVLAPRLGLPTLPMVEWPDTDSDDDGLHWKTRGLVDWAQGRPFVWVDDEISPADRAWVHAHHPVPTLLHRVDARQGLTDHDFALIRDWLRAL